MSLGGESREAAMQPLLSASAPLGGKDLPASLLSIVCTWRSPKGASLGVTLTLSQAALSWRNLASEGAAAAEWQQASLADIVGAAATPNGTGLDVFWYPEPAARGCCSCGGAPAPEKQVGVLRHRTVLHFLFSAEASATCASAAQWASAISHLALGLPPASEYIEPAASAEHNESLGTAAPRVGRRAVLSSAPPQRRRLLVFVNPVSGLRQGKQLYTELCRPMFADAGCDTTDVITRAQRQATDELLAMPWERLAGYDGVVAVGGDGILSEVLHGLMGRPDWAAVVDRVTVGVLPAGSGNGLVCSLLAAAGLHYSLCNAAMLVAKQCTGRMDVASTFILGYPNARAAVAAAASSSASRVASSSAIQVMPMAFTQTESSGHAKETSGTAGHDAASAAGAEHHSVGYMRHHHDYPAVDPSVATVGIKHEETHLKARRRSSTNSSSAHAAPAGLWGSRHYQFLSTAWAIIADIDIESEVLRCIGPARIDVYGAVRALFLRRYRGTFSYLPAAREQRSGRRWSADAPTPLPSPAPDGVSPAAAMSPFAPASAPQVDGRAAAAAAVASSESESSAAAPFASGVDALTGRPLLQPPPRVRHLTPFDSPPPLQWRTVEGVFTLLYVTNSTHQSIGVAVSPDARHDDGCLSVTIVRDCSAPAMVSLLLSLDDNGTFLRSGHTSAGGVVETYKCLAFRLEPESDPSLSRQGHVALDGEDVAYGPIQAEVHPRLLRVYGPPSTAELPATTPTPHPTAV